MSLRKLTGRDVFDEAVERIAAIYRAGHHQVVSFSAGKDSTVVLELAIIAARQTGRLPVKVAMRDDEIMLPGTFEYAERVAARPEVEFHWLVAQQPIINVFNRQNPYFWAFDPLLPPSQWVREPPPYAEFIPEKHIAAVTARGLGKDTLQAGQELYAVIGIRGQESAVRQFSIHSAKGHLTKPQSSGLGARNNRPIYDWSDGDVWKAIKENGWDYNAAYNTMLRHGVPRKMLRIAPPTMNIKSIQHQLRIGMIAFPRWFDRVEARCPGVRTAVQYGERAVTPDRRINETWEQCFHRACIDTAPAWIAARAKMARDKMLRAHAGHSTAPFPEVKPCYKCTGSMGSWKALALSLYNGDPFAMRATMLPYVEPEFFRQGAGKWGGKASF